MFGSRFLTLSEFWLTADIPNSRFESEAGFDQRKPPS